MSTAELLIVTLPCGCTQTNYCAHALHMAQRLDAKAQRRAEGHEVAPDGLSGHLALHRAAVSPLLARGLKVSKAVVV